MHTYAAATPKTPGVTMRAAALLVAIASAAGCGREARPVHPSLSFPDCAGSVPAPVAEVAGEGGVTPMVMRLDAHLTDLYALSAVCLRVDRQRVYVRRLENPAAIRSRVDVPVNLRPATSHLVELVALYHGTGDYTGYKFSIFSSQYVTPENVPDGVLGMHIVERGGADRRLEERPIVEWSVPSDPQPTDLPAAPDGRR